MYILNYQECDIVYSISQFYLTTDFFFQSNSVNWLSIYHTQGSSVPSTFPVILYEIRYMLTCKAANVPDTVEQEMGKFLQREEKRARFRVRSGSWDGGSI